MYQQNKNKKIVKKGQNAKQPVLFFNNKNFSYYNTANVCAPPSPF